MKLNWTTLNKLEQEYGDSFYLVDLERFEKNYQDLLGNFRAAYTNSNIAYSYKTNYIPHLCTSVNSLGGFAEVVSRFEYELALQLGISPSRIIFNGPYKTAEDLEKALLLNSCVNIDSLHEVSFLEHTAAQHPSKSLKVGLRCKINFGQELDSRFGLSEHSGEFTEAINRIRKLDNCEIVGIHCHSSSYRDIDSYRSRAEKLLLLYKSHFINSEAFEFIDIGGGFYSKMPSSLDKQFATNTHSYSEYAEAIGNVFATYFPNGRGPLLLIEPGMALVADVMSYVAKVINIKKGEEKSFALLSGSIQNLKQQVEDQKNLPIRVLPKSSMKPNVSDEPIDFVGYTCMEGDCLYKNYTGHLRAGDYVVFDNIGAYSLVMKPPFIRLCPPIIGRDAKSHSFKLLRREEHINDYFESYRLG